MPNTVPDGPKKTARKKKSRPRKTKPIESGYRGFIALARSSGELISINAQVVHRNDRFDFAYGLAERLEHVPAEGDRGEITHFYAYAKFKDGGHHFDVLSRAEVDAVRDRSESYQAYRAGKVEDTAWVTAYEEMGKKTVLRRIAQFLPLAVQKAAAIADLYESGKHAALDDPGQIVVEFPEAESAPVEPASWPSEGIELSEDELEDLFPPAHIIRILDAVVERNMSEEVLAAIVGKPLDDVTEEDEAEILRAITEWRP